RYVRTAAHQGHWRVTTPAAPDGVRQFGRCEKRDARGDRSTAGILRKNSSQGSGRAGGAGRGQRQPGNTEANRGISDVRTWRLECSACDHRQGGDELATVCPKCGQPLLVRYDGAEPKKAD